MKTHNVQAEPVKARFSIQKPVSAWITMTASKGNIAELSESMNAFPSLVFAMTIAVRTSPVGQMQFVQGHPLDNA